MEPNRNTRLIGVLNRMLAKEYSSAIRYATYAALISGPLVDPISSRFHEIASDELAHAALLRKRICGLGGTPTMEVENGRLRAESTLDDMVEANILEEREAIEEYGDILETIPKTNVLLYKTLEDILRDEQEHLEELLRLEPKKEELLSRSERCLPPDDSPASDSPQPHMAPFESRD